MSSDSAKFHKYMQAGKGHVGHVKEYSKCKCGMAGAGKMSKKALVSGLLQNGGSWSDFTGWVKGAANTVAKGVTKGAKAVYNGAIKPAANYIAKKPLTAIGTAAGTLGMIPSPWSGGLKAVGAAASTVGRMTGTGKKKVLMSM